MNETIKNLSMAFVGESQARNRYTLYADIAKKEGLKKIAEVFLITADNEREHAKWNLKMINELSTKNESALDEVKIETAVDTRIGDTRENISHAIAGEDYETMTMYPQFAEIAEKEGFFEIAQRIRAIGVAEKHHRERYKKLLSELKGDTVVRDEKAHWICEVCGYVHEGDEAPERCPSCDSPSEYFVQQSE